MFQTGPLTSEHVSLDASRPVPPCEHIGNHYPESCVCMLLHIPLHYQEWGRGVFSICIKSCLGRCGLLIAPPRCGNSLSTSRWPVEKVLCRQYRRFKYTMAIGTATWQTKHTRVGKSGPTNLENHSEFFHFRPWGKKYSEWQLPRGVAHYMICPEANSFSNSAAEQSNSL